MHFIQVHCSGIGNKLLHLKPLKKKNKQKTPPWIKTIYSLLLILGNYSHYRNSLSLFRTIFKNLFIFNWRIIASQDCVAFCLTARWISHRHIYVPSLFNTVFFLRLSCAACRILIPWPGTVSRPMAVKVLSPDRWIVRELPRNLLLSHVYIVTK